MRRRRTYFGSLRTITAPAPLAHALASGRVTAKRVATVGTGPCPAATLDAPERRARCHTGSPKFGVAAVLPPPTVGTLMRTIPFADPGTPDTRGPLWFLVWVGRQQWRTQVLGAAHRRGLDGHHRPGPGGGGPGHRRGHRRRATAAGWSAGRWPCSGWASVAAAAGAARHYFAVHNWLYASYRSAQLTARRHRARRPRADPHHPRG